MRFQYDPITDASVKINDRYGVVNSLVNKTQINNQMSMVASIEIYFCLFCLLASRSSDDFPGGPGQGPPSIGRGRIIRHYFHLKENFLIKLAVATQPKQKPMGDNSKCPWEDNSWSCKGDNSSFPMRRQLLFQGYKDNSKYNKVVWLCLANLDTINWPQPSMSQSESHKENHLNRQSSRNDEYLLMQMQAPSQSIDPNNYFYVFLGQVICTVDSCVLLG